METICRKAAVMAGTLYGLDRVHCQMEENELSIFMNNAGYKLIKTVKDTLPNGKSLVRLDYEKYNFDNTVY